MNVWIFQTGEPLHCDGGKSRPMRAMNLANALVERGHNVLLWSSAFYHQEKRHRSKKVKSIVINKNLTINLIPSPGYKRNIGLGRLFDHAKLALNLSSILKAGQFSMPDIAFVGYPPIETSAVLLSWLRKNEVPSVIDVKDQWPSLFLEPFPIFLRPIVKVALAPYFYYGRRALRHASAFTTMSRGYLEWMSHFSGRALHNFDMITPLTAPKILISEKESIDAENWLNEQGISTLTNRRFSFIGSFMSVFDFSVIRDVASRFIEEGIDCQFVICGDGGHANDIRSMMQGLNNVIFPGWIDAPKIAALAKFSMGSLIPYKNIENFTLNTPNKVIDALAHGLPIITTLSGEVEQLVETEKVGFACNVNTGRNMYGSLKSLLEDPELHSVMSKRALALYENKFGYDNVYGKLVDSLEYLAVK